MKKLIIIIYFQIGVTILGFPDIINHDISKSIISKSKYY
jgi:hypothetical protein